MVGGVHRAEVEVVATGDAWIFLGVGRPGVAVGEDMSNSAGCWAVISGDGGGYCMHGGTYYSWAGSQRFNHAGARVVLELDADAGTLAVGVDGGALRRVLPGAKRSSGEPAPLGGGPLCWCVYFWKSGAAVRFRPLPPP